MWATKVLEEKPDSCPKDVNWIRPFPVSKEGHPTTIRGDENVHLLFAKENSFKAAFCSVQLQFSKCFQETLLSSLIELVQGSSVSVKIKCHDSERLVWELQYHLIPVKEEEYNEIPHLPMSETKAWCLKTHTHLLCQIAHCNLTVPYKTIVPYGIKTAYGY